MRRLGPGRERMAEIDRLNQEHMDELVVHATRILWNIREKKMHYRNGREAKNGDKIISLAGYGSGPVSINAIGILFDAVPGNDHCNGSIAPIIGGQVVSACLCDCLHVEDLAVILKENGLDKRPSGK